MCCGRLKEELYEYPGFQVSPNEQRNVTISFSRLVPELAVYHFS